MKKTLTKDDFIALGFVENKFWKDITDDINLILNPNSQSVIRIQQSGLNNYKWFVEIETFGTEHRWNCSGHINTISDFERMLDFAKVKLTKEKERR